MPGRKYCHAIPIWRNVVAVMISWISTAPSVPPKTIRAAVGCSTCPRLPPSISNPATMPAMARIARDYGYTLEGDPQDYDNDAEALTMRFTDWYCAKAREYLERAHG